MMPFLSPNQLKTEFEELNKKKTINLDDFIISMFTALSVDLEKMTEEKRKIVDEVLFDIIKMAKEGYEFETNGYY